MPQTKQVDGPALVNSRINQDPNVSQEITLLGQRGSTVTYGNMLLVPIEKSLLWVRPLYVEAEGSTPLPQLKRVILVFGDRVVMRDTLHEALVTLFGDAPPTLEAGSGATTPTTTPTTGATTPTTLPPAGQATLAQLLAEADGHFTAAQDALRRGDLATYQKENDAARESIRKAAQLATPSPTPTTTTTTPPTTRVGN